MNRDPKDDQKHQPAAPGKAIEPISRRDFLNGLLITGASASLALAAGCMPSG